MERTMAEQELSKADLRAAAIAACADAAGVVTAERVLEAAKDPTSVLHDEFEWNDDKAAHQHRLDQARTIIKAVKVQIIVKNHRIIAPFYVRDPQLDHNQQGY